VCETRDRRLRVRIVCERPRLFRAVARVREKNSVCLLTDGSERDRTTDGIGPSDPHCVNVCAAAVELVLLPEGGSGGGGPRRRGRHRRKWESNTCIHRACCARVREPIRE